MQTFSSALTSGSPTETSPSDMGALGHSSSGFQKNSGPINHLSQFSKASADIPLEAWSPEFAIPSTWRHWCGVEPSRIMEIRFATKV